MYEVYPRRGFTRPSMILVWNGPRWTLSHTITSSSMLPSGDPPLSPSTGASAPSEVGMVVANQQESNHATLVVDHGMVRLSISLCRMTMIILPIVQVPTTRGTLSEIRLIGHHQEHHVFIISCYTPHLNVQDDKPKRASTFPT